MSSMPKRESITDTSQVSYVVKVVSLWTENSYLILFAWCWKWNSLLLCPDCTPRACPLITSKYFWKRSFYIIYYNRWIGCSEIYLFISVPGTREMKFLINLCARSDGDKDEDDESSSLMIIMKMMMISMMLMMMIMTMIMMLLMTIKRQGGNEVSD